MSETAHVFDVAIIGLGPAGASAARAIAAAGRRVVAFDRKREAGTPVQCAEFVPLMLGEDVASARAANVQMIDDMLTFVECDAPDQACNFSGRMIDRATFDAHLVSLARKAGAHCQFGVKIDQISPQGQIHLDQELISAKIIIGADGPLSIVGQAIGHVNEELLETRQITVPLKDPHRATDIFLSDAYPGGYGWLFPKGDKANIGLGLDHDHRDQLKPLLEHLHERLIAEGRVGEDIIQFTGGPIPAGGMVKPYGQLGPVPVLLAGDAAGLTNCITGAGIASALLSGRLAGEAAIALLDGDPEAGDDYVDDLNDMFGAALARACAHRQKLKNIRQQEKNVPPSALRRAWIAYPQYWT